MKRPVLKLILWLLPRALNVLMRFDASVAEELAQLGDGACVRVRAGMTPDSPALTFVHDGRRLHSAADSRPADIEITFKSESGAFRVFTGCESMGRAYCGHRFVLKGNINETMCLLRAIETAEGYLFPRLWNRRILKSRVKKQVPATVVYALALCGR